MGSPSGTLREKAHVEESKQERMLKCFRWGVPDGGIAEICEVNLKTVQLFREKVACHGRAYHERIQGIYAAGVQLDELRAKQGGSITWVAVAIVMRSFLILAVSLGSRNQLLADKLLAEVWGRCCCIGMILSDGWRCYYNAILRCYGRLYRPKKASGRSGKMKSKRLKFDKNHPFYGQVIKQTTSRYQLCAVKCRAILGTMRECLSFIGLYQLGKKIHTSHIERWFGNLRCHIASLRRKSRCLGQSPAILLDRIWIFVTLHNWILTHHSLTMNGIKQTPAMAAGLIDHPLTYREFIRSRIFVCERATSRIKNKLETMREEETVKAAKRTKRGRSEEHILWHSPPKKKEVAA